MAAVEKMVQVKKAFPLAEVGISLGLFLLALLPRAYDLERFVTADEAKWVYRSAQFLAAFLQADFAETSVNLTPAVTTTWLGSAGLALYYQFHQGDINMAFIPWLLSLPEFRTELTLLNATRWPVVILSCLGVVAVYLLTRRLFDPLLAVIAAVLLALDPHPVALSRILGHDAPTAIFMPISILLLLLALTGTRSAASTQRSIWQSPALLLALSGLAAGLAFLSKAPAFFLIPYSGLLFLVYIGSKRLDLWPGLRQFGLWLGLAYLAFVLVWPAAWLEPVGRPLAVVENGFLSATDEEEAESENYWRVPDLGPAFYLINGIFKLSPLVTVGLLAALGFSLKQVKRTGALTSASPLLWLAAFVLLFTIFMTLGEKRSARYILPIFPALAIIAASGWQKLYQFAMGNYPLINGQNALKSRPLSSFTFYALRFTFPAVLTLSGLIILVPYSPYYLSYFNPLVGGAYSAPALVKIGWGEGLDQVGRFLQREQPGSRVGTAYASTVAPFFKGDLSSVTGDRLDFVVLYRKQVQAGDPSPAFIRYFEQMGSIFSVNLNGIHYADVYPGPAVQPAVSLPPEYNKLAGPLGFRPFTPYGQIGQTLELDVVWPDTNPLPVELARVSLQPVAGLQALREGRLDDQPDEGPVLAEGPAQLSRLANGLVVSHHQLLLPEDLDRGSYALWVDGWPLGEIEARQFQAPASLGAVEDVVFGNQIALTGYRFEPTEDYIRMTVAWQAQAAHLPDYTVFSQLLDAETNERLAGVDTQPLKGEWPTSRWVKGEVVVDDYFIAVPPDFPPGFYKVIVGLYRPESGERLTLAEGQDSWLVPWTFIRNDR
jgi:4-amino-4-deoxy-L-arabinose transferase-like glycosyltransferase